MPLAHAADRAMAQFVREGERLRRESLETEWLLTNGLGGFAQGTLMGTPTRRYHGMLIAAMHPPVDRVNALTAIDDTLVIDAGALTQLSVRLTPIHFEGAEHASSHPNLVSMEQGHFGVRWRYRVHSPLGEVTLDKTLYLYDRRNAVGIRYAVRSGGIPIRLELRPLIRLGDMHALQHEGTAFMRRPLPGGCFIAREHLGLHLHSKEAAFRDDPQWWRRLTYWWEQDRGLDHVEDLYCPGRFEWTTVPASGTSVLTLHASTDAGSLPSIEDDAAARDRRLAEITRRTIVRCGGDALGPADAAAVAALARATDAFLVRRGSVTHPQHGGTPGVSIIAGYPWFADWGRDSMISLEGLLLVTGRFDEAQCLLQTFAERRRRGIIPNRFDDLTNEAHYNTVDASLWFIHACCRWARLAREDAGFPSSPLAEACLDVVEHYARGTDFDIRRDPADGLIAAGSRSTQLTWMDAARDGVVFTPRHGKAVEINALWHSALLELASLLAPRDAARADELRTLAAEAGGSLRRLFWNPQRNCLFDRLEADDAGGSRGVGDVRPNQVFAVSLPHSPLTPVQQRAVLSVVRDALLTPHGLRTLAPGEPGYRGRFEGPMPQRDAAYHNGTVWPWLIGPFVEGVLRVHGPAGSADARRALAPLVEYLDSRFLGKLPEVFDGDDTPERPQRARACTAQAWSVAETLRALALVLACERGDPVEKS